MNNTVLVVLALLLGLSAPAVRAEDRFGLPVGGRLEVRAAPDNPTVIHTLPEHPVYFRILAKDTEGTWLRISSLPSQEPSYAGWVPAAGVELFGTEREARGRFFQTHPMLERIREAAAVLAGEYWDLRDQGADVESRPGLWLRYGFDFQDWYIVRGKTYEAELRDLEDIEIREDGIIVLWIFTPSISTPPEPMVVEILSPGQIRVTQLGEPPYRFGRARPP